MQTHHSDIRSSDPFIHNNDERTAQEIADDALAGWHAARYGMPLDWTQAEAWVAGWHLWHETHD